MNQNPFWRCCWSTWSWRRWTPCRRCYRWGCFRASRSTRTTGRLLFMNFMFIFILYCYRLSSCWSSWSWRRWTQCRRGCSWWCFRTSRSTRTTGRLMFVNFMFIFILYCYRLSSCSQCTAAPSSPAHWPAKSSSEGTCQSGRFKRRVWTLFLIQSNVYYL